jgi:hypothetical protein
LPNRRVPSLVRRQRVRRPLSRLSKLAIPATREANASKISEDLGMPTPPDGRVGFRYRAFSPVTPSVNTGFRQQCEALAAPRGSPWPSPAAPEAESNRERRPSHPPGASFTAEAGPASSFHFPRIGGKDVRARPPNPQRAEAQIRCSTPHLGALTSLGGESHRSGATHAVRVYSDEYSSSRSVVERAQRFLRRTFGLRCSTASAPKCGTERRGARAELSRQGRHSAAPDPEGKDV